MHNPIRGVTQDKRTSIIIIVIIIVLAMVLFFAPRRNDDNNLSETPKAPDTKAEQPSDALLKANISESHTQVLMAETASEDAAIVATTSTQETETGRVDVEDNKSGLINTLLNTLPKTPTDPINSNDLRESPQVMLSRDSKEDRLLMSVVEKDRLIDSLRIKLEEAKKQGQTLNVRLTNQLQRAEQKTNEAQRWQDEARALEMSRDKLIEDNNRNNEMLSREVERWRERALQAERENASLRSRHSTTTTLPQPRTTAIQTTEPVPRQQPAPLRPRAQLSQPAVPVPQADFTTTCYDPNQGYFACTVRQ